MSDTALDNWWCEMLVARNMYMIVQLWLKSLFLYFYFPHHLPPLSVSPVAIVKEKCLEKVTP